MATHLDMRHEGSVIRYNPDLIAPFEARLFDVAWLKEHGYHQGSAAGRGDAHFLEFGARDMVLRPYLRGGLVRKFSRDLFLHRGLEASRSFREFALTAWMKGRGLPVPRVVAAKVAVLGPFYRAALITERIPDAHPVEDLLWQRFIGKDLWRRIGQTIRQLHDAGVYHSDLNRRNILLDTDENVWLIDFDKCERRAPGRWLQKNLDRLHRSLSKCDGTGSGLHWDETDWAALMAGYNQIQ